MPSAHKWQIQGGYLPNILVGVDVTEPHWPGGRGEKGNNMVTAPKGTPKDLFIPVLKSLKAPRHPTVPWENMIWDLPPPSYKSNTQPRNKTSSSITHQKDKRKRKGKRMEEGNSLLKSSIKLRESPQTAQEITLSCLAGRELINAIRKQV